MFTPTSKNRDLVSPAQFLVGQSLTVLPDVDSNSELRKFITRREATWRLKHRQLAMNGVSTCWNKKFTLQQRSAHQYPNIKHASLKMNEVVLLVDKRFLKYFCKLARATKVYAGKDGYIRACLVKE